jgi:DNA-directed RNA polymerase specialized sigma24 family protein
VETDGALIERSVCGRPDAFVEVVRRHEMAVHGYLARRAGRDMADDLLSEVWLRSFAARGGYDPARADARLDLAAGTKRMLTAVRALPRGEREVLLLVAWEQLTPAEAALVLGIPQGTARSRLRRARGALRQVLGRSREHQASQDGEEDACPPRRPTMSNRTR